MPRPFLVALTTLVVHSAAPSPIQSRRCDTPLPDSVVHVPIDGQPVDVLTDGTGCHVFVTVARSSGPSGILLLRRTMTRFDSVRFIGMEGSPFLMKPSADGKRIYVAAGNSVSIVDGALATSAGNEPVVGVIRDSSFVGAVMANVTADNQYMFISQERASAVTVVDLRNVRGATGYEGARIVGRIPTGRAPIAVELSPDGRRLYVTSQEAPASLGWPIECRPQANRSAPPDHIAGAVLVIDVERAKRDPAASVLSTVKAGCNPVRLALSPDGLHAYVTARTDDEVMVFDARTMEADSLAKPLARVAVGQAPVGIVVTGRGDRVIATSSNRFAGGANDRQYLYVIDPREPDGRKLQGRIAAGAFPRQLHLAADQRTLFVTNFASGTLQVIDMNRVRLEPPR